MLLASPIPETLRSSTEGELGAETLRACQSGESRALVEFVRCYERRVFAYLSRILGWQFPVEDLAQEVFLRAYTALGRFDTSGSAKLSTWLLSIAHHVAVDARRRGRTLTLAFEPDHHRSPTQSPEQLLEQERLRRSLVRAVEQLPVDQRDVFVLAEFHDLSTAEIAEVVGARQATVKTRLYRAKARLRLALGPDYSVMT